MLSTEPFGGYKAKVDITEVKRYESEQKTDILRLISSGRVKQIQIPPLTSREKSYEG